MKRLPHVHLRCNANLTTETPKIYFSGRLLGFFSTARALLVCVQHCEVLVYNCNTEAVTYCRPPPRRRYSARNRTFYSWWRVCQSAKLRPGGVSTCLAQDRCPNAHNTASDWTPAPKRWHTSYPFPDDLDVQIAASQELHVRFLWDMYCPKIKQNKTGMFWSIA